MVERIAVLISPHVVDYLDELLYKLYVDHYFSFIENAEQYVTEIYESIPSLLQTQKHKQTPKEIISYGEFYVSYKTSNRTTWYIFFSRKENRFLVRNIINNHVEDARFLEHL